MRIGITGGIGSGKTTLCSLFEKRGIKVFYADEIARNLINTDPLIRKKIILEFGEQAYLVADGTLNRQYIGDKVFSEKKKRDRLNAIVHPRVIEDIEKKTAAYCTSPQQYCLVEAALMFESGLNKKMDYVLSLITDDAVRRPRLEQRYGAADEDIQKRINAQLTNEYFVSNSDFLIVNNRELTELQSKVNFFSSLFHSMANQTSKKK
jgi:dephospho-CoA kinase